MTKFAKQQRVGHCRPAGQLSWQPQYPSQRLSRQTPSCFEGCPSGRSRANRELKGAVQALGACAPAVNHGPSLTAHHASCAAAPSRTGPPAHAQSHTEDRRGADCVDGWLCRVGSSSSPNMPQPAAPAAGHPHSDSLFPHGGHVALPRAGHIHLAREDRHERLLAPHLPEFHRGRQPRL